MRTNYVLIDHENVQPTILPMLKHLGCKVMVFVGANQTKMPFETAASLQELGSDACYVKITGSGPNALDLHIAFYIGELARQNPGSFFHIISRDMGFDPLVEHLKSRKIFAVRSCSIAEMPLLKTATPPSTTADKQAAVVARLRVMDTARPGSMKTLLGTIHALFQEQLPEAETAALAQNLIKSGIVKIEGTRLVYSLSEQAGSGS